MTDLPSSPTQSDIDQPNETTARDPLAIVALIAGIVSLAIPVSWLVSDQSLVALLFAIVAAIAVTAGVVNVRRIRHGEAIKDKLGRIGILFGLISLGFFLCFLALVARDIALGPVAVFKGGAFQLGEIIAQGVNFLTHNYSDYTNAISLWVRNTTDQMTAFLIFFPPWLTAPLLAGLAWWISRRKGVALFTLLGLTLMWNLGLWEATMQTLVQVILATAITVIIGLPIGVIAAIARPIEAIVRPILDFMQTLPAFVYLIPAISFFSLGTTPAIFATVIFAMPPCIRLTVLGIQGVPKDLVEAADAFGSTAMQKLFKLQLPNAAPAIRQGINQTIMLSLSMVVIAAMVGAPGLGQQVWIAIQKVLLPLGFNAGLGIVILAIILDRVTQSAGTGKR